MPKEPWERILSGSALHACRDEKPVSVFLGASLLIGYILISVVALPALLTSRQRLRRRQVARQKCWAFR